MPLRQIPLPENFELPNVGIVQGKLALGGKLPRVAIVLVQIFWAGIVSGEVLQKGFDQLGIALEPDITSASSTLTAICDNYKC